MSDSRQVAVESWQQATDKLVALDASVKRGQVGEVYLLSELIAVVGYLTASVGSLIVSDNERGVVDGAAE